MDSSELRKKAEQILHGKTTTVQKQDVAELIQELEVHQIELELQNGELRQAQSEIDILRQKYLDLFMLAPIGYLVIDKNGKILDLNLAAGQMLRLDRKRLTGQLLSSQLAVDTRPTFYQMLNDVSESEVAQTADLALKTLPGGGVRYVSVTAQAFYDGVQMLIRLTLTDVTERVTAEKRLKDSEERFRRAVLDAPEPIMMHAEDGEVIMISRRWTETTGYAPMDIPTITKWIDKAFVSERRPIVKAEIKRLYSTDTRQVEQDYTVQTRGGGERIWEFSSAPLGQLNDGRRLVMSMARDVTERRLADEKIQQLNRDLEQKISDLAYVYEISSQLARAQTLTEIVWTLFRELAQRLNSSNLAIGIFDESGQTFRQQIHIVNGEEQATNTEIGLELTKAQIIDAIQTKALQVATVGPEPLPNRQIIQEELYVPVVNATRTIGILRFQSNQNDAYQNIDRALLKTIMAQSVVAIENALLYEKMKNYTTSLEDRVKRRTEQLGYINQRMSTILNSVNEAILLVRHDETTSVDNLIDLTNPGFSNVFGYKAEAVNGRSIGVIVDDEDAAHLFTSINKAMQSHAVEHTQLKCKRSDGSTFDADLSIAPVQSIDGYVVCTIFDISDFKAVERLKDGFIATVNHELRTPLSGIVANAGTLAAYYDRLSDAQRLKRVTQIQGQAEVMTNLINAILDSAQVNAQNNKRGTETIDIVQIAQEIFTELYPEAESKHQSLTLHHDLAKVLITGAQIDFARIWRNLIGNAIKYTQEEGQIQVILKVEKSEYTEIIPNPLYESYLVGQVIDNGPGISPDDVGQLFTRFFRGWAKNSTIPGTGLGLSLVREILNIYGGEITIDSALAHGTTFTFWLPLNASRYNGGHHSQ